MFCLQVNQSWSEHPHFLYHASTGLQLRNHREAEGMIWRRKVLAQDEKMTGSVISTIFYNITQPLGVRLCYDTADRRERSNE